MDVNTLKSVYFIGAGGIGMSALVRYFLSKGKKVGGYDRTPSELTLRLIEECFRNGTWTEIWQETVSFHFSKEIMDRFLGRIPDGDCSFNSSLSD